MLYFDFLVVYSTITSSTEVIGDVSPGSESGSPKLLPRTLSNCWLHSLLRPDDVTPLLPVYFDVLMYTVPHINEFLIALHRLVPAYVVSCICISLQLLRRSSGHCYNRFDDAARPVIDYTFNNTVTSATPAARSYVKVNCNYTSTNLSAGRTLTSANWNQTTKLSDICSVLNKRFTASSIDFRSASRNLVLLTSSQVRLWHGAS